MGLISECSAVFAFLRDFFSCLPNAIQILVYAAFGGAVYICLLRSLGR